jgi:hypothetical protein
VVAAAVGPAVVAAAVALAVVAAAVVVGAGVAVAQPIRLPKAKTRARIIDNLLCSIVSS